MVIEEFSLGVVRVCTAICSESDRVSLRRASVVRNSQASVSCYRPVEPGWRNSNLFACFRVDLNRDPPLILMCLVKVGL
jgi:hypothetical protein